MPTQSAPVVKPYLFPHIDLSEQSSRKGVSGPRYVPLKGVKNVLGDTNTGKSVHARIERS